MEEAELLQALRAGREDAYKTLIALHGDRVYNTVLSLMQHEHDAEDVVQEVFIAVHQKLSTFRGEAKLSTWMYRIAVTKSLEALRKAKGRRSGLGIEETAKEIATESGFHHPGLRLENRERGAALFRALAQLPGKQKTAFVLHKAEGLSYAEIAAVMETTLPAVESLIYRARQTLQMLLASYYHE